MARRVHFGIVVGMALGLGIVLGIQGSRSLEILMEREKGSEKTGSFFSLRSSPGEPSDDGLADPDVGKAEKTSENEGQHSGAELEIQEAKQSVLVLLNENEKIRKEVLDLEKQIRRLTHSLAEEKIENDRIRVKFDEIQDKRTVVNIPGPSIPEFCEVIDINKDLKLVVLNRGSEDGIQHRMQLTVIRNGSSVARLEAVNVRSRITGAAITFLKENETIVAGDRVIPVRN